MKKASDIMYKIGKVFNIVELALMGVGIILGIILAVVARPVADLIRNDSVLTENLIRFGRPFIGAGQAANAALRFFVVVLGINLILTCCFSLAVKIVALVVVGKAHAKVMDGSMEVAPHVWTIVLGAFTTIFYVLCGIFGLVARGQDKKATEKSEE